MGANRFDYWFSRQFGLMLFWQEWNGGIEVSIGLPFLTVSIIIGGEEASDE